ncbi:microcystin-dependent protein [Pseudomonas sp. TE6288]|jgi:microcystin-dependent protein|uniref:Phage tail protein n=1 Tax=Pseudomonas soli TaxID=1306993 RepID=A0A2V4I5C4_9PSED|nr:MULTISPECIES: tail fiber protein [Pseudomonas]PMZ94071.1 phage tail protein [Pseudomonas sp. FW305-42]PNA25066.1 phage tail protein [Pseudomonas sp. MPR-R1B]PNB26456.1 phage tail protein [Pseudomonas sp. DP16D-E2]PNB42183.1 phage tail protein [Pseudomonas sp. FW305-17]PNB62029.1 phage tail protein [Pseudomonas sp. GW531-E2]
MSEPFIGQITLFAGNFAPRGWMFCQGQLLSIAQNTALFSILGTTYGGNGQTTFALPDLRGRAPVQQGQGPGLPSVVLGEAAGTPTTTLTSLNMASQAVNIPAQTVSVAIPAAEGDADLPAPSTTGVLAKPKDSSGSGVSIDIYASTASNTTLKPFNLTIPATTGVTAAGNQPFSNQSPYLGINFIIATEGIFPSRN